MSNEKVPEMSAEDKAHERALHNYGPPVGATAAYDSALARFVELALENARLKAERRDYHVITAPVVWRKGLDVQANTGVDRDSEQEPFEGVEHHMSYGDAGDALRVVIGALAKAEDQRDRAVEMLNAANRRLTALIDATEEKDVAGG